jgi:hypothetical protein
VMLLLLLPCCCSVILHCEVPCGCFHDAHHTPST